MNFSWGYIFIFCKYTVIHEYWCSIHILMLWMTRCLFLIHVKIWVMLGWGYSSAKAGTSQHPQSPGSDPQYHQTKVNLVLPRDRVFHQVWAWWINNIVSSKNSKRVFAIKLLGLRAMGSSTFYKLRRAFFVRSHLTFNRLLIIDEETDSWANLRCSCTSDDSNLDHSAVFAVTKWWGRYCRDCKSVQKLLC